MIYVYLRGRLFSFARAFRMRKPRNIQIWRDTSPVLERNSRNRYTDPEIKGSGAQA